MKMATPGSPASEFEAYSPAQVCSYLKKKIPTLSEDVLVKLQEHKVDGTVFLELNSEYLREVTPLLGDRLKLKTVLNTLAFSVRNTPLLVFLYS